MRVSRQKINEANLNARYAIFVKSREHRKGVSRGKMNGYKWNRNKGTACTKKQHNSSGERKRSARTSITKAHETEEEAVTRRYHDAQRMARFRARKKKASEEAKMLEIIKFTELSVISELKRRNIAFESVSSVIALPNIERFQAFSTVENSSIAVHPSHGQSRYSQLLAIIEELGKDVKLAYAGSRTSAERLKAGIIQARMLIRECLLEIEMNSQQ